MVEALDIIIDRCSKGIPRKGVESWTIEKIGCIPILIKKIEGGRGKVILQDPGNL